MSQHQLPEDQEICPLCKDYLHLLRISQAAKKANVSEKTIYRYIEEGSLYCVKIVGKTYRVCKNCLIRPYLSK